MIRGEQVEVRLLEFGAKDRYGNRTEQYAEPITVCNVLVGTASTVNVENDGQPHEIRADRRFCFPRCWCRDLRGALITRVRDGKTYKVVGDPASLTDENLPNLPWNTYAETVRYDG